jgi:hypothetical protein
LDDRQSFPALSLGELFLIERDRRKDMFRDDGGDCRSDGVKSINDSHVNLASDRGDDLTSDEMRPSQALVTPLAG